MVPASIAEEQRAFLLNFHFQERCTLSMSGISRSEPEPEPELVQSSEKLLKTTVGAIAIKDRIDGEVFHPDSAIDIRGL
jgi:hypothetical protein